MYTIKPLEWIKSKTHAPDWSECWNVSIDNDSPVYYGLRVTASTGQVVLSVSFDEYSNQERFEVECSSVDEAKQKAKHHWESENGIGRWLQKVTVARG